MAFTAQANVQTDKASRYLQALCGHFDRKVSTAWTAHEGNVNFGFGHCQMTADNESLAIYVQTETEEEFARVKHVVSDHLERFAVKDGLKADWIDEPSRFKTKDSSLTQGEA